MELLMIAVIEGRGFRLLDIKTHEMMDASTESVYNALRYKKANIVNLKLSANKITGANGSLNRYPHLNGSLELLGKAPIIIISKIGDIGYEVTDYSGYVRNMSAECAFGTSKKYGLANGKTVKLDDGTRFISPINGKYNEDTWIGNVNNKLALLGMDYRVGIFGTIHLMNRNIRKCIIPRGIQRIGDETFARCGKLECVVIPDTVHEIGANAFEQCTNLREIDIPGSVEVIQDTAFYACNYLEKVTLHNGLKKIRDGAFMTCESLKNIVIPDTVDYVGEGVFRSCIRLTDITIGQNMKSINEYTFAYCDKLKSIFIPKNIELVDDTAFMKCSSLKQVILESSKTEIQTSKYLGCPKIEYVVLDK